MRFLTCLLCVFYFPLQARSFGAERKKPMVFAHRGYPCKYPEETLKGFEYAIDLAVDFIEMDVVCTKDNHLIARHDVILDESTDIRDKPEFAFKKQTRMVDDLNVTGFFAMDFTLEEIKKLRAIQSMAFRDQSYNFLFQVPTLAEVLDLVKYKNTLGRKTGVYIETKLSEFHSIHSKPLEDILIDTLISSNISDNGILIYIQSFSLDSLSYLKERRVFAKNVRYCFLTDKWLDIEDIIYFSSFGHAIGLDKNLIYPIDTSARECNSHFNKEMCSLDLNLCAGRLGPKQKSENIDMLKFIRSANLEIHVYTFRNENGFMALNFSADPFAEMEFFSKQLISENNQAAGLDGIFSDCAQTALTWRDSFKTTT